MRQWIRYNQIAHYLMNRSDFEIKIVQKIECLICISKGSLLLKHPVVVFAIDINKKATRLFLWFKKKEHVHPSVHALNFYVFVFNVICA